MVLAYECGDIRDGEATMQGKHAKIVGPTQERAMLGYLETTRYPHRNRVMAILALSQILVCRHCEVSSPLLV